MDDYSDRDDCWFCGCEDVLEEHHIVPRRHGGSDADENLVTLCPTCHRKLETLYDERFYKMLAVGDVDPVIDFATNELAEWIGQLRRDVDTQLKEYQGRMQERYQTDENDRSGDIRRLLRERDVQQREVALHEETEYRNHKTLVKHAAQTVDNADGHPEREDVVSHLVAETDLSEEDVRAILEKLRHQGDLYEPRADKLGVL